MASNSELGTVLETTCSLCQCRTFADICKHLSNVIALRIRLEESLFCDFPVLFFENAVYLAMNIIPFFLLFYIKAKKSPGSESHLRIKQTEIHLDPYLHFLVFLTQIPVISKETNHYLLDKRSWGIRK